MQSDPSLIAQVTDHEDVKRIAANVGVIADFVKSIEELTNRPS
ncbi:MAG TPA: hypothetical protein VFU86_03475 [Terriglobales bacterium]|nr:hypothetical protein [Terriglobales bacterium]